MKTSPESETQVLEWTHSGKNTLERREQEALLLVPDADLSFPDILQNGFFPEELNCERRGF